MKRKHWGIAEKSKSWLSTLDPERTLPAAMGDPHSSSQATISMKVLYKQHFDSDQTSIFLIGFSFLLLFFKLSLVSVFFLYHDHHAIIGKLLAAFNSFKLWSFKLLWLRMDAPEIVVSKWMWGMTGEGAYICNNFVIIFTVEVAIGTHSEGQHKCISSYLDWVCYKTGPRRFHWYGSLSHWW